MDRRDDQRHDVRWAECVRCMSTDSTLRRAVSTCTFGALNLAFPKILMIASKRAVKVLGAGSVFRLCSYSNLKRRLESCLSSPRVEIIGRGSLVLEVLIVTEMAVC
jgi:hypothetical protein